MNRSMTEEANVKLELLKEKHGGFLVKLLVQAGRELEKQGRHPSLENRINYVWDSEGLVKDRRRKE